MHLLIWEPPSCGRGCKWRLPLPLPLLPTTTRTFSEKKKTCPNPSRGRTHTTSPPPLCHPASLADGLARSRRALPRGRPARRAGACCRRGRRRRRLRGRDGGPRQGECAAAQDHRHLLHPRRERDRGGRAVAGAPVPRAPAGDGPVPRRQGLRGRRHPRHGAGAHPAGRLRGAAVPVPGARAVEALPVRRAGRHARRGGHAHRGHRRHGVLPPDQRQAGRRRHRRAGAGRPGVDLPRPRARDVGSDRPARRRRAGAPPRHLSGAGAGRGGALAHHRHVAGRLRLPEHGAAAGPGADVPPALRGHRARRLHRPGQVPAQVRGGDGGAVLDDDAGGDRGGDRDIQRVRRDEPDGAGGAGAAGGGGGGDPGVHGAGGHPGRGLQQAQGAEQGAAAARAQRLAAARGWPHVPARGLGLT